jgi:hypothetical protein
MLVYRHSWKRRSVGWESRREEASSTGLVLVAAVGSSGQTRCSAGSRQGQAVNVCSAGAECAAASARRVCGAGDKQSCERREGVRVMHVVRALGLGEMFLEQLEPCASPCAFGQP